jgi:hypothetical protein
VTEAQIDRLCGEPSETFEQRLEEDARRMAVRLRYTGSVAE